MTTTFGNLGYLLNSLIIYKNIEISEFFLRLLIYFILIITSLVHNEFIILNFCQLQKHTRLSLEKEAEIDINQKDTDDVSNDIYDGIGINDDEI